MRQAEQQEEIGSTITGRLPSGRHGLPREAVVRAQRERLIESMIAVVAEIGYTEATVADVIRGAGVSRTTFCEQFTDKEDCFVAAYGSVMDGVLERVSKESTRLEDEG